MERINIEFEPTGEVVRAGGHELRPKLLHPVELANEIIYWEIATRLDDGPKLPYAALLEYKDKLWFGSEKREARNPLKPERFRKAIENSTDNLRLLTRGLLLDMALLNTDRETGHFLLDEDGVLWQIDHEKTLWGKQKEDQNGPSKEGLMRIDVKTLPAKKCDFLGDYLVSRDANPLVWTKRNKQHLQEAILWLERLEIEEFRDVCCTQVPEKIRWGGYDSSVNGMTQFLSVWWSTVGEELSRGDAIERMQSRLFRRAAQDKEQGKDPPRYWRLVSEASPGHPELLANADR